MIRLTSNYNTEISWSFERLRGNRQLLYVLNDEAQKIS